MTIEVEVFGNEGIPKHKSNITGYSFSEDSTPISPGDSSGGVGSISFEALDDPATSHLIYSDEVKLTDSHNGSITGHVTSISGDDGIVNFDGISNLSRLNIPRTVPQMNTTVGELLVYIFAEAGILTGYDIDPDIEAIPIITPNYDGDLWVFVKEICTANEFEITLVSDIITVRKLRQNTLKLNDIITESWSVDDVNPAQYVEVNYYNYSDETNFLAYPKGGWNKDVQVYQVDANQTLTVNLPVDAYLTYIEQPVCSATVDRYEASNSVYCVAGKDGLPITPAQWLSNGGDLTVELSEDGKTIIATIVGANITDLAPFRIGVSAGPSDYYSGLRLMGAGIAFNKQTVSYPTGLTEEDTSNIVGITIDNKLISTKEQADDAARRAIIQYALPKQTYSFSAPALGDFLVGPGTIIYERFFEYDLSLDAGELFSELDTELGTWDFFEFDANLPSVDTDGAITQVFGNVNGARIKFRDSWYRVRSATITQESISASSEWDNLVSDFNTANAGETFSSFTGTFDALTFKDFSIIPMRTA